MRMTRTGAFGVGTAAVCVLLLAAAWFLLVAPQRSSAGESRVAAEEARTRNAQLEQRIADLEAQYAQLPAREAELAAIREAIPATAALSGFLAELTAAAETSGTVLESVTTAQPTSLADAVNAPADGTAEASPPAVDSGTAGTGTAADAAGQQQVVEAPPAPLATPAPTPTAAGASATAEPGAGEAGGTPQPLLVAVPVTLTVSGDFFAAAAYVKALQTEVRRALIIDSLAVSAVDAADVPDGSATGSDGEPAAAAEGLVTADITGRIFVLVDPQAYDAGSGDALPFPTGPSTVAGELP